MREPQIEAIQFWRLEADAAPPLVRLIVEIHGRRCIRDRDRGEPVSGDPEVMTWFHQFWDMGRRRAGDAALASGGPRRQG